MRSPFANLCAILAGASLSILSLASAPPARAASLIGGKRTLTMWGPGVERSVESEGFDAVVTTFEKAHNCRIVRLSMGAGSMDPQKLMTAIAGRVPPDLVLQDRFTVGDWASRDAFEPLDDLIARDRHTPLGVRPGDYYPGAWEEAVYKGHVYGIPNNTSTRALYYNRTLFRAAGLDPNRPPRTWEELKRVAVKLTQYDERGNLLRIGYLPGFGNTSLYLYSWANGGSFMSDDGRTCTFASPENIEALRYVTDLTNAQGGIVKVNAFQGGFRGAALDPFLTGKVAMKVDGNWSVDAITRYNPYLDFAIAPVPVPEARLKQQGRFKGMGPYTTWSGGFSWVIPRGVKGAQRDLAWEFIKWDESLPGQRIRYAAQLASYRKMGRTLVPEMRANRVVNAALMDEFVPKRPRIQAAMKVFNFLMPYSRYRPVTFVGQRLWDEQLRAMELSTNGTPPKEALLAAQAAVQKQLDKAFAREKYRPLPNSVFVGLGAFGVALLLAGAFWVLYKLRGQGKNAKQEALAAYLFAAPWIVGFAALTLGPILASVVLSFCDYDVLHSPRWVGALNYAEILNLHGDGAVMWKAFTNAAFMCVVGIPMTLAMGLAIALLLNTKVRGMNWYRTAYYLPAITPVVANAILWLWLLNPQFGIINHAWAATLTSWFGVSAPNWMTDPSWAKPAFILMGVWGAGSGMILWLAGLQGIPQHLYEAAELDGAGLWHKFRNVMLPMLSPTIFFLTVMGVIGSLQIFEVAYIMRVDSQALGSPNNATMFPVVLLFQNAFQYFKMGYASALAWVLFIVILAVTLVQLKMSKRWVHYGD